LEATSTSKSVLIGIPHREAPLDPKFLTGLFANVFTSAEAGITVGLHQAFGQPLDHVRNTIVNYFLEKTKATHLFFLDDDVLPPPDAIVRLLKRKTPIISGLYQERSQRHRPIIIDTPKGHDKKLRFFFRYPRKAPRNKLLHCDVVPAGCLMIERRVFRSLRAPWFHADKKAKLGEDVYFSLCARRAGFKVAVDTGVDCLHIVTHVAGSDEAIERWKREFDFTVEE
jgi:GT2 family glycosyltransferase